LTEVEVHGSDLDLGLEDWSEVFVAHVLPIRLDWLATRRSNHRSFDRTLEGSWLLVAEDGPATVVSVRGPQVTVERRDQTTEADAVIVGSRRDLLALLLGRPTRAELKISGDVRLGRAFGEAFPGP
jgi:predicted lipid carrier protein YhbT